jgi:hypothetical protein
MQIFVEMSSDAAQQRPLAYWSFYSIPNFTPPPTDNNQFII